MKEVLFKAYKVVKGKEKYVMESYAFDVYEVIDDLLCMVGDKFKANQINEELADIEIFNVYKDNEKYVGNFRIRMMPKTRHYGDPAIDMEDFDLTYDDMREEVKRELFKGK